MDGTRSFMGGKDVSGHSVEGEPTISVVCRQTASQASCCQACLTSTILTQNRGRSMAYELYFTSRTFHIYCLVNQGFNSQVSIFLFYYLLQLGRSELDVPGITQCSSSANARLTCRIGVNHNLYSDLHTKCMLENAKNT